MKATLQAYTIKKLSLEDYLYFVILLLAAAIPLPMIFTNVLTMLLLVLWGIKILQKPKTVNFYKNSWFWLFASLFFLSIIGLLHSDDIGKGLFNIEKTLSFLIFPLVFFDLNFLSEKILKNTIVTFALSLTLTAIGALAVAFTAYHYGDGKTPAYDLFSYHTLSEGVGLHAMYMSSYVCFAIFGLVYYIYFDGSFLQNRRKLGMFWVFFLSTFLILLSTRILLLTFFLLSFISILLYMSKGKEYIKSGLSVMGLGLFMFILVFFSPRNRERIHEAIDFSDSIDLSSKNSMDKTWGGRALRIAIWQCAWDIIKEKPLIGVGNGDAQAALQQSYKDNNFDFAAYHNSYNAHSQYVQHTVTFGVFGLLVLLANLLIPFWASLRAKNILYLYFLSIIMIGALTEVILARNKGIVFYAFFMALLGSHFQLNIRPWLKTFR